MCNMQLQRMILAHCLSVAQHLLNAELENADKIIGALGLSFGIVAIGLHLHILGIIASSTPIPTHLPCRASRI